MLRRRGHALRPLPEARGLPPGRGLRVLAPAPPLPWRQPVPRCGDPAQPGHASRHRHEPARADPPCWPGCPCQEVAPPCRGLLLGAAPVGDESLPGFLMRFGAWAGIGRVDRLAGMAGLRQPGSAVSEDDLSRPRLPRQHGHAPARRDRLPPDRAPCPSSVPGRRDPPRVHHPGAPPRMPPLPRGIARCTGPPGTSRFCVCVPVACDTADRPLPGLRPRLGLGQAGTPVPLPLRPAAWPRSRANWSPLPRPPPMLGAPSCCRGPRRTGWPRRSPRWTGRTCCTC